MLQSIALTEPPPIVQAPFFGGGGEFTPPFAPIMVAGLSEPNAVLLLVQSRDGERQEFEISPPNPTQEGLQTLQINSDRQEFDEQRQVVTAEGNVQITFAQGVLRADRVQVNLDNQFLVADGNVSLQRGEQLLQGERFEYSLIQNSGRVLNASGEIFQPTLTRDLAPETSPEIPLNVGEFRQRDRVFTGQTPGRGTPIGGYSFRIGSRLDGTNLSVPESEEGINWIRFTAQELEFVGETWRANNISLTNDPFSPPELEIRADTAEFRRISPTEDVLTTTRSRVVFDQGFSLPIFQDRIVFDQSRDRDINRFTIGYDDRDRGGLFIGRNYELITTPRTQLRVTPQYLIQRSLLEGEGISSEVLGLDADLRVNFSPRTTIRSSFDLSSLDLSEVEDNLRFNFTGRQVFGNFQNPYLLNLEYNYRDRFFNGSLGQQTVQSSLGAVLTSPNYVLGESQVNFRYQLGVQDIVSATDQQELLRPEQDNDLLNLTRYQAVASFGRDFLLWEGNTLPPTAEEGLRYSPVPVQPFLSLNANISGINNSYSNQEVQRSLGAGISLQGQVGQFSRRFFDYTAFNLGYRQVFLDGESPFIFDRVVDKRVLSLGLIQQIYGPFRLGFQSEINLDRNEAISTDYFLQYSRRTYNIVLRYNPEVQIGSLNFRINDLSWLRSF